MTTYKPFNNLNTQHESHQVNIDLSDNVLPPINTIKTALTLKWALILGCIHLICAVSVLLTGFIWWFVLVAASFGLLVILGGIYPNRFIRILLILSSMVSIIVSVIFLIYMRHWREKSINKYSILLLSGLIECLVSTVTFIMVSQDVGCCGYVVSPNTNIVYFKRAKVQSKQPPYFTQGPSTIFPEAIKNTKNSLTTFTSIGSIFRFNGQTCHNEFQDGQHYGEVHYGPCVPPYLDPFATKNKLDENSNINRIKM